MLFRNRRIRTTTTSISTPSRLSGNSSLGVGDLDTERLGLGDDFDSLLR